MCGVSFYCKSTHSVQALQKSLYQTSHRGPDATGVYSADISNYAIGLGHNRLSILDLSEAGSQPMESGHGTVLSYNGEIYNFSELREELTDKGYSFRGHSDTEVILWLYAEFGERAFSMLRGMFAFVLLDERRERLYVVRDRLGIKPIYLYENEGALYGSSEIRGLSAFPEVKLEVDKNDIFEFFNTGFLYEPSTGFLKIKKLLPGHYLRFDLAKNKKTTHEFEPEQYHAPRHMGDLMDSVLSDQTASDVPLGVFFSGGTDSSIIANYVDADLFFAKYEADPVSDVDAFFSEKIAKHLNRKLTTCTLFSSEKSPDELLQSVDFVAKNTEEPISDYTFWAAYKLSHAAKKAGYTVMLSGMGGDEIFAGYPRYLVLKAHYFLKCFSPLLSYLYRKGWYPSRVDKKIERLLSYAKESNWPLAYSRLLGFFSKKELRHFFSGWPELEAAYTKKLSGMMEKIPRKIRRHKVKLAQRLDLHGFLSHNLLVSDKASMLASLELRVPLLDERIVSYGQALKCHQLIKGRQLKRPLTSLLSKVLNKHLTKRPKTGFNPPLEGLIEGIGLERLRLEYQRLASVINIEHTEILLHEHFSGGKNNTYKLWQLLYFSRWLYFQQEYSSEKSKTMSSVERCSAALA